MEKITKEILKDFHNWENGGNVFKFNDGYSTQCAQWKNRLTDRQSLLNYFIKEYK